MQGQNLFFRLLCCITKEISDKKGWFLVLKEALHRIVKLFVCWFENKDLELVPICISSPNISDGLRLFLSVVNFCCCETQCSWGLGVFSQDMRAGKRVLGRFSTVRLQGAPLGQRQEGAGVGGSA